MKKKIAIEKKLSFSKTAIAMLNADQQQRLAGGNAETRMTRCATERETCQTIPYTQRICYACA
ncbi:class I lanthipeptide [Chitinophaga solisilvae]|uniref:Uncharacterized protein n=1 Tax=Chitinophaga solisilvae TaxID=1233460 RepID=A0A3S1D356_9BACT|nr:class I lanthipeptide [Chitinophaga solisilvae]NSL90916.1 hypothetical protein [Chitinophaga solisilvae]